MMQVLMMFLVSIIIFFVTTLLATKLSFEWGMLWFGMGLVILTIFIHSAAYTNSHYKTLYVVCFVVNMIGTGLSFGTFFNVESVIFRGYLIPFVVAGSLLIAYLYTLMVKPKEFYDPFLLVLRFFYQILQCILLLQHLDIHI